MPQVILIIIALILSVFFNSSLFAQSTRQKTQDLIAALAKTKYKKKEKKNFTVEVYVDVKNEAVVKNNVRDYAGVYESEDSDSNRLELRVSSDGSAEGSGYESDLNSSRRRAFTLKNGHIDGALLTAVKVYSDGSTENLEAVFSNRTVSSGKNVNQIENRETKYGLGFIRTFGADVMSRYFLEFK